MLLLQHMSKYFKTVTKMISSEYKKDGIDMSLLSFFMCHGMARSDRKRDAGLTTPEDILRFDDIRYGADKKYQVLDIYRPKKEKDRKLLVIVSIHGGAWIYGSKEIYQYYCMSLAQQGFALVNFSYRLAPKHKYPAAVEDINSVFNWIIANRDTYGLDTDNLFAVGDSAGAHLLAVYACVLTNPDYGKYYAFKPDKEVKLRAIALNCGKYVIDQHFEEDAELEKLLLDILPEKGTDRERYQVTPTHFITSHFPPAYLMTAEGDFLKNQAPLMKERFDACGVPYVYKIYGDKNNPLEHVFHCNIRLEAAQICNEEECGFFRGYII